ncbi:MAG TPA: hypothetical protein VKB16_19575 [Beijerinckiaceae bacterium]|nr:hypothetical protein [Beijerinckiaceae bacterium]
MRRFAAAALATLSLASAARAEPAECLIEIRGRPLERDDFSSSRHPALPLCLSMIFSENR